MLRTIQLHKMNIGLCMLIASVVGCHRQYYRKQADCEAHALIAEKAHHVARPPQAPIRIDVDRRSRMFNPFDLDFQPMPLDDPASYRYMQCVDGKRGYPMWEAAGLTNQSESPDWWQYLPLDEDGVLVLNGENAVQIALLHSADYQQQVEQLYLAALAVSGERFVFDTQFFGGASSFFAADGPLRGGATGSSTTVSVGPNSNGQRDLSLERRLATGGELIAGVANSIVWELSGPNTQSASTVLDFSLIQPLLRNAGRDRVLEQLTASERALLASIRAFERYRRSFFLNVTIGRGLESTVANAATNLNLNGTGFGTGGGGAGGFLGLLQTQLRIRNAQENIARQAENLLILEDSLIELLTTIPDDAETIVRQRLQVAQAKSQLLRSQSGLVDQQAAYERSVDQFLRTLGLPPYICVRLDDPILDSFELIDRRLLTSREELSSLRAEVGEINVAILESGTYELDPDTRLPIQKIEWTDELAKQLQSLEAKLKPLEEFTSNLLEQDPHGIRDDLDELAKMVPARQRQSDTLKKLYETEKDSECGLLNIEEIDEAVFEVSELDGLGSDLSVSYGKQKERLLEFSKRMEELQDAFDRVQAPESQDLDPQDLAKLLRERIVLASQDIVAELGDVVLALQLIQARARTESVLLPDVDIDPETAFKIARKNRRDWANARAALVDSWRAIEVTADDLESTLDVVFSGDVQNVGNNPLDLRSNAGRLRVGLQWDAPITRLQERNAYRSELIRYEQAKRRYYGFEDSIWQLLRSEVRRLRANRLTFELGRQAVRIAASQIELNADIRALNDARGRSSGPTAARDAISALADLLDAQNGLLDIFVNHEIVRRGLEFDLGTMELTPEGLWIDSGELSPELLLSLPGVTAGGPTGCECNECGIPIRRLPEEPELATGNILQESHGSADVKPAPEQTVKTTIEATVKARPLPQRLPAVVAPIDRPKSGAPNSHAPINIAELVSEDDVEKK